ncbi:hypothetical protein QBC44DRAFT_386193 [Cladorrhinum sp. PSN332]|nr:hypothetical protein QBC44DRAFT_386193 [Cladorrhinum sp. PSN332]
MATNAVLDVPSKLVLLDKNQQTNLRKKFYPALVLLKCLNEVCPQKSSQKSSDSPPNPNQSPEEMFHTLVNKLAQVCDTHPKGDTVTALAVIQHNGRICYVLASNRRGTGALNKARTGLAAVLNILKCNLEDGTRKPDEATEEKLMRKILELHTVRVRAYLTSFSKELQECIKRCDENKPEGKAAKETLERLACTIPDSNKDGQKSDSYIGATIRCIKTIQQTRNSSLQRYIEGHSVEDNHMAKGGSWSALQHVSGRLLSYQYAVQTLVHAHHIWAETNLFRDFDIASVRSSGSYPADALKLNPEPAEAIINRAPGCDQTQLEVYIQHASDLQRYGVNAKLEDMYNQQLDPVVHAEMLLHEWLSRTEHGIQSHRFFLNFQYIGSSKPPCRLCQEYFTTIATPVRFRSGHPNTYLNWRLPDMYVNNLKNEAAIKAERDLWGQRLGQMRSRVYAAVLRVLEEKVSEKKALDSNTYSERITAIRDANHLANWLEKVELRGGKR